MTPREIDALIAEKIFGWKWWARDNEPLWFMPPFTPADDDDDAVDWTHPAYGYRVPTDEEIASHPRKPLSDFDPDPEYDGADNPLWFYSTDPAGSKRLREKLAERGAWSLAIQRNGPPFAKFLFFMDQPNGQQFFASADTEEMVVALCALRSVGVEV